MSRVRHDMKTHAAHYRGGGDVHVRKDHMASGGMVKCADGGAVKGDKPKARADRPKRASGGFIKDAIKRPGALHRALGVPQGEKIPAGKLAKAAHSDNPRVRREANLAKTLGKLRPH